MRTSGRPAGVVPSLHALPLKRIWSAATGDPWRSSAATAQPLGSVSTAGNRDPAARSAEAAFPTAASSRSSRAASEDRRFCEGVSRDGGIGEDIPGGIAAPGGIREAIPGGIPDALGI